MTLTPYLLIFFTAVIMAATVVFYKRIRGAQANYEESKDIVRSISSSYRRQLEDQSQRINALAMRVDAIEGEISKELPGLIEKVESISKVKPVKIQPIKPAKTPEMAVPVAITKEGVTSSLTETEVSVLRTLTRKGPKTASQIRSTIGRSREHTARLMKKLYVEGYIERDTHRIPYRYRPTKDVKELLKEKTGE